jgi:phage shock protein PspC (stress-responsive transcriptional regulator)
MVFVANPNHPAKNLTEAIAMVRAKPEAVSVGNPTRTSIPHLAAELMGLKTGTKFQQVSFANTGQGVQAVVNGDINMDVDGGGPLVALVKAGRMKMLAVASETELPGFEGIPLANKSVPGLNVSGWFMMLAPKGTPTAVLQRVNADVNKAMQEPDVQAKFREFVLYPTPGSVADTQKFLSQQKALFGGVIRDLGPAPAAQAARAAIEQSQTAMRQLKRSVTDRWLGGVAGGLAQATNIPTWAWRILFILTAFLHGLGVLMYVLLWIFVPMERPMAMVAAVPAAPAPPPPSPPPVPPSV